MLFCHREAEHIHITSMAGRGHYCSYRTIERGSVGERHRACAEPATSTPSARRPAAMVLVRGLDRLPGTAQEHMSDDEWAKHTAFIQGEFEAEVKRSQDAGLEPPSFTEFARPFADRFYGAEVREQVAALRAQADANERAGRVLQLRAASGLSAA